MSPEVIVKLIGMLDEMERLFGDPARAWAAIKDTIEYRKARRESRESAVEPRQSVEIPGVSMPSPSRPTPRGRRPFVGFDREMATYERLKSALLEAAEGKWVVIVGEEALGPFDDISEAEGAGLKGFGLGPLFIKQVLAQEPPPIVLPWYLDISCLT